MILNFKKMFAEDSGEAGGGGGNTATEGGEGGEGSGEGTPASKEDLDLLNTQHVEDTPDDKTPDSMDRFGHTFKSEEARKHANRFADPEALTQANMDLRKKVSNAIHKPGKEAKDEEVAAYRKAIGVPEKPEDYNIIKAPDGKELPPELQETVADWQKVFHENNVPAETAQNLLKNMVKEVQQGIADKEAADAKFKEDSETSLKEEWTDDYDVNLKIAEHAGRNLLGEEDYENLKNIRSADGRHITAHPSMLRMMVAIGREMQEGGLGDFVQEGSNLESLDDKIQDARDKVNKFSDQHSTEYNRKLANKWNAEEARLIDIKSKMKKK
ncbi:hypothetical protein KAR91_44775 [Candidatus Pacearchaeota archaeon]|nr:hypothetical protein [Candidatus Pacearchaeota archaeon]